MDGRSIKKVLNTLGSSSRTQVINNLVKIRQQMIGTKSEIIKLISFGGVPALLNMIVKPNEKIIDITLSILGNCCMVQDFANEFVKLNGIHKTVAILRNLNKDSILCRGCRLIGNIAQFESHVDQLHQHGTIAVLCTILNSSSDDALGPRISPGTELMAVRALRLMWTTSTKRSEMLAQNVANIVSMLMIRRSKNEKNDKQINELLMGIIRCLLHFSEHPSHELAQQILADGNGYKCMVELIPMQPYIIVKCISNLLCVATTRSQFATEDVVIILIERLSKDVPDELQTDWPNDELRALCLMCKHVGVRQEIRTNNGLSILLSVIKNCSNEQQKQEVLQTLLCFLYDERSLQKLISEGLVLTLVQYFEIGLKSKVIQHDYDKSPACSSKSFSREQSNVTAENGRNTNLKNSEIAEILNSIHENLVVSSSTTSRKRRNQSPIRTAPQKRWCFDSSSSSPNPDTRLSPQPNSPLGSFTLDTNDSDGDSDFHYSPVCSDSESDSENFTSGRNLSLESLIDDDFLHYEMDDSDLANAIKLELKPKNGESRVLGCILLLLSRVSYMNEFVSELADSRTIKVLLNYMKLTNYPLGRAAKLLVRIVSCCKSYSSLLLHGFPIMLHDLVTSLPHSDKCKQCEDLRSFAQSVFKKLGQITESFGKGEIEHRLLCTKSKVNHNIIIAIPHVVQSKGLLRSFCGKFSVLQTLLDIISDDNAHSASCAINAVGVLAVKLKIKNPKDSESFVPVRYVDCNYEVDIQEEIISFRLDDDTIVRANKSLLVKKSDFFKTLLTGKFKESTEEIVRLKNITHDGLKYLLILIENEDSGKEKAFPLCDSLPVMLEVLIMSDRYLIDNLTDKLTRAILKHRFSADTTAEIYTWSIESGTDLLRVEALAFGLVATMTSRQRSDLFQNIMTDGYGGQLVNDIKVLLQRYLKIDS